MNGQQQQDVRLGLQTEKRIVSGICSLHADAPIGVQVHPASFKKLFQVKFL